MATDDTQCFVTIFRLLNFLLSISTVSAARYCYHGTDVSSIFKNQSCTDGTIHLSKALFETNYEPSPAYKNEKINDERGSDRESMKVVNHHCFIFSYITSQVLDPNVKHESSHMEFGCDLKNICRGKELNKVLSDVTVNGSQGHLYCCDTENCNDNKVSELPHMHLPAENRVCYYGTRNKSETLTAEKVSCARPDVMCAKIITFFPDGDIESYFCDNKKTCKDNMTNGAYYSCHKSNVDNRTQELCCCDRSLCFVPPEAESKSANLSISYVSDTGIVDSSTAEKDDRLAITGLVAALAFVAGIGGGIIIVMVCKMRWKPRPDPNVIMQYERLSASDVDVDDAVVL